jgi:hypothetical protein
MDVNLGMWPKAASIYGNVPENKVVRRIFELIGGKVIEG